MSEFDLRRLEGIAREREDGSLVIYPPPTIYLTPVTAVIFGVYAAITGDDFLGVLSVLLAALAYLQVREYNVWVSLVNEALRENRERA